MKRIYIFDMDGTLARIPDEYWALIRVTPHNWDAFHKHIPFDTVIEQTADIFRSVDGIKLILTARDETCRESTAGWLLEGGFGFDEIFMRAAGDHRLDTIVKKELLDRIRAKYGEPFAAFEDREHLASMFAREGVFVFNVGQNAEHLETKK